MSESPGLVLKYGIALWLAVVLGGTVWLWSYASAPGEAARPTSEWPEDVSIERASDRATLVMLAHPRCPCTRASIEELAVLMTQAGDALTGYVLFMVPPDVERGWERTDLWSSASRIPGIRVVADPNGEMAKRFDAKTSGQVVVYDAEGGLLFAGGITSARGHSGDNAGRRRIVELVRDGVSDRRDSPVFGCELEDG